MLNPDFIFPFESPIHLFLLPPKPLFFQFISYLLLRPPPQSNSNFFEEHQPLSNSLSLSFCFMDSISPYIFHCSISTLTFQVILPSLLSSLITALRPATKSSGSQVLPTGPSVLKTPQMNLFIHETHLTYRFLSICH